MALTLPSPAWSQPNAARVVDRYSASWAVPPTTDVPHVLNLNEPAFPSGPFAGNGDVSFLYTGNGTNYVKKHTAAAMDWQQWLYMSKNDLWGSDQKDYYPHLSAGRVGILVTPPGAGAAVNGSVHMFPGNASIVHTLTDSAGGASVAATTRVLENNVIVTTLTCASSTAGGACPATLLLSDTNRNYFGVQQTVGVAPDSTLVWWRKENLHAALNPAYIGSCDPHLPLQSVERRFTIAPGSGDLRMVNGSCLWADEATASSLVTSGSCAAPQGGWRWTGNSSGGDIVHTASAKCLSASLSLGACGSMPWAQAPSGSDNSSEVYLSSGAKGCLVVVPDNNNNTLGVAVGLADDSGALVPGKVARVSATDPSAGVTLSLSLKVGVEYTVLVGQQTLRDIGCAGVRPQWEACSQSPEDAAASLVRAMAPTAARAAAVAHSADFWAGFWGASAVDLAPSQAPSGANASLATVERWYYLAQYLLGCTTRDGKVTSALDGFACVEPVPWGDQFTLDYNLEATFWGAGSSNRLGFIHPVMASSTNPGAVATARLRAQNPGTWNRGSEWPGHVGSTVAGAVCNPDCPNITSTGFRGAEWPAAAMPLGDGRLAESDLQSRFSGGLLATNLIQYWEYSRNLTTLRERIYPFVKDNAEFYLSYAIGGADGKLQFPYSCAQEACACRDAAFAKYTNVPLPNFTKQCKQPQSPFKERCPYASGWELNHPCYECMPDIATGSPDGYHNAHPDVAFASSSFRNAVRFAKILNVDSDMAAAWQQALDSMPPYPAADFTFVAGAKGEEFNGGAGFFVEAEYGHHAGVGPAGNTTTTPVVWPWCNKEYPVSNFAAMWPTDEIGATQTTDAGLLARAKQTVYALNKCVAAARPRPADTLSSVAVASHRSRSHRRTHRCT